MFIETRSLDNSIRFDSNNNKKTNKANQIIKSNKGHFKRKFQRIHKRLPASKKPPQLHSCALCERRLPKSMLPGKVTKQAIWTLRREWVKKDYNLVKGRILIGQIRSELDENCYLVKPLPNITLNKSRQARWVMHIYINAYF